MNKIATVATYFSPLTCQIACYFHSLSFKDTLCRSYRHIPSANILEQLGLDKISRNEIYEILGARSEHSTFRFKSKRRFSFVQVFLSISYIGTLGTVCHAIGNSA
ncbi:hypothetical protein K449DRAFT_202713 [Hypoxylon sp. EC38]|nr:hypothetical protein K449DRAFT_202713 [Hypoxylon sp. EC38]